MKPRSRATTFSLLVLHRDVNAMTSSSVRVVTYNVLANVYAKSAWFPWTERALMKAKSRLTRTREYIRELDADVLCLQELDGYDDDGSAVTSTSLPSWRSWLESEGYDSRHVRRTNTKKDGSCVAWRRNAFTCVDHRAVSYNDIAHEMYSKSDNGDDDDERSDERERYLRDCVANLTVLKRMRDGAEVLVCSTHIFWDPQYSDVKVQQAKRLVEECERFVDERASAGSDVRPHVIIGGDFNSEPDSDVYRVMTATFSSASSGREPAFTNVTPSFTACIDYIFVSDGITVTRVKEQPRRETLGEGLPNETHPSDHLPVVVDVLFE